jgi:hypothetical protein
MVITSKMVDELCVLYRKHGKSADYRMMCREVLKGHGVSFGDMGKSVSDLIKAHSKRKKENRQRYASVFGPRP